MDTGFNYQKSLSSEYVTNGYVVCKGLFNSEWLKRAQLECERIQKMSDYIHKDNLRCRWTPHRETGELVLDALDPVIDLSSFFAETARGFDLSRQIKAVTGRPHLLFKDKILFRPPGASGYSLHQDFISWPEFPTSFMTALIAIDPSTSENGCLQIFKGGHRKGLLCPNDGDYHDIPEPLLKSYEKIKMELLPGDVIFFSGFLPHKTGANLSDSYRKHLYLSFNAIEDGGCQREKHYVQYFDWLKKRYSEYGYKNGYFK